VKADERAPGAGPCRGVVASAPGRAGILGNPTDGYGGTVISCSIPERATATLEPADVLEATVEFQAPPGEQGDPQGAKSVTERSAEFRSPRDLQLADDGLDVVRSVARFLGRGRLRARIHIRTDVPVQCGLAGSTAVLSSLLAGALRLLGDEPTPDHPQYRYLLAEMVRTVELNFLKVQCGYQDQYMTVFGGLNCMDFRGKEFYRTLEQEFFATVEPLGHLTEELPLVVISTGLSRVSGHILKPVRDRWLEGDPAVRQGYRQIAELARLGKRALLTRDWRTFASLMNQNHAIQRQVGASGDRIDEAIDLARHAGAWGAKLAGAGGGGSILMLHPDFAGEGSDALSKHPIIEQVSARYPRVRLILPTPCPGVTCEVE